MYTIVLDDGNEYAIVKEEVINNIEYTLFSDLKDNSKICFRKTIIEDGEVEVDESFITGESKSVYKKKGDMLLSGSFIISGNKSIYTSQKNFKLFNS